MTIEKMTPAEKANRRLVVLLGALLAMLCFSAAAVPKELDLPREQVALLAPPFVHPHDQATNQGFIRGGSAGALYTFRQPGIYVYLTHNLIEAVELGATAHSEPIAALCARSGLQALREAQEEMTVRDTAAATGIKESSLRRLLRGLPKEGRMCGE